MVIHPLYKMAKDHGKMKMRVIKLRMERMRIKKSRQKD